MSERECRERERVHRERVQRERRNKLVPTLAPRLGVGLCRAGLGLGCAIANLKINQSKYRNPVQADPQEQLWIRTSRT